MRRPKVIMLSVDRSPRANRQVWCKYCNAFVHNDAKSINHHNAHVTHQVNVKKFEQRKRQERTEEERKSEIVNAELDIIRAKAQQHYIAQDVVKQDVDSLRRETEEAKENFDIAKQLYGEDTLNELMEPKKKVDKTEVYNQIMKSLPTRIQKKYRKTITEFKE